MMFIPVIRWLAASLAYAAIAIMLYGIWRGTRRRAGRMMGREAQPQMPELRGAAKTLLVPLACRALESRRPDGILHDPCAVDIYNSLGADPSLLMGMGSADQFVTVLRARQFDRVARTFLGRSPRGLVVDLGCGLDTRAQRLDDGGVDCLGIDLPEVIELRRRYIPDGPHSRTVARSMLEVSWLEEAAPPGSPVIFLAEGVFPYFSTAQVKPMILAMAERFPRESSFSMRPLRSSPGYTTEPVPSSKPRGSGCPGMPATRGSWKPGACACWISGTTSTSRSRAWVPLGGCDLSRS